MKLDIAKLADGKEVFFEETLDPKVLDLDTAGREFRTALGVVVAAKKDSGIVNVHVKVSGKASLTCSRCFKDFEDNTEQVFNFIYPVDLSDRIIKLEDDIRSEIILNYTQKILCKKDCKGLCSRCGIDLNENRCACKVN